MKEIAILTDTNSGILKSDPENGLFVVPMPVIVDEKEYLEGINISHEEFYKYMDEGKKISTSQPSVETIKEYYDKLLDEYEEIVYIPMSSSLSNTKNTAEKVAADYGGRVHVADNTRISMVQKRSALAAVDMREKGLNAKEIKEKLEETKRDTYLYLAVQNLKYLKQGGRITPAVAAIGSILRIKPVLKFYGGKMDAFANPRTEAQMKKIIMDQLEKDFKEKFDSNPDVCYIDFGYTRDLDKGIQFMEEVKDKFEFIKNDETKTFIDSLALSIAAHTGPGAVTVSITGKWDRNN